MCRLSLAHLTIDTADPLAFIDAAAQAGFDRSAFASSRPRGVAAPGRRRGRRPRPIKASLDAGGLDVLQVNSFWIMPQTAAADFRPVLDAAARLQARPCSHRRRRSGSRPGRGAVRRMLRLAEPLGIGIALEFRYSPVRTVAQAVRMVEASGFATAGLVVDALHLDPAAAARRILPPCRTDGSPSRSL